MRDLSLHILDLMENSIRAGASVIEVTVSEDPAADTLRVCVEDNGPGLESVKDLAADPFYTTKANKKTGLGLSLFKAAAERAGGAMAIGRSRLGGASIEATMRLRHIDRSPLGDLAATLSSVVCTNPELDLVCRLKSGDREWMARVSEIARTVPVGGLRGLAVAREMAKSIRSAINVLSVTA